MCGGSLIRPNVILTAAHCVEKFPQRIYSARAGTTIKEEGGQVAQVSDVCTHPKYDNENGNFDISVLKLDKAFELNSDVQLVNLQNVNEEVQVGTLATVTGWGVLEYKGKAPKNLQKVEVPKVDDQKCKDEHYFTITDSMVCYGFAEGKKDACQGDSGGPLVSDGKQVGIVSFGYRCALPNSPGIYTRLENEEVNNHIINCLSKFESQ